MELKDDVVRFENCLKLATEAKKLRDNAKELLEQAQPIEERAVESFRQVRSEMLELSQHDKEKIEEELKALKTEYSELASMFCKQKGHHTNIYRTVRTSYTPLYHSFSRGDVYPTEIYTTCLVCGYTNDPKPYFHKRFYRERRKEDYWERREEEIQRAVEQTKNLELKKTAQRILEIREQFKILNDKLDENSRCFEKICSLFGHDAHIISYDRGDFECKCCGKVMSYGEYIDAHYAAKYRGGIVPFYYADDNPILY